MIEDVAIHSEAGLTSRVIQAFPEHFHGQRSANLVKVKRRWQQRNQFEEEDALPPLSCNQSQLGKEAPLSES